MLYYLKLSLFKLVRNQLWDYRYIYIIALSALALTHWGQSELPFLAKNLGDLSLTGNLSEAPLSKYVSIWLFILVFRTFSRFLFFYPARLQEKKLRMEAIQYLEQAHPHCYNQYSMGQLFQLVQNSISEIRVFLGFAILQIFNLAVAMIILIPRLVGVNLVFLYALFPLGISVVLFSYFVWKYHPYYRKIQDYQGDVQNFIIESFKGKGTIMNFHAEDSFIKKFQQFNEKELDAFYTAGKGRAYASPLINLGVGLTLLLGAYFIFKMSLPVSTLILFSGFVFLLREPLMFISWIGVVWARTYGAHQRLKSFCKDVEERELKQKTNFVNHLFQEGVNILVKDLPLWKSQNNFEIKKGVVNAIVGKTGSGKTTLLERLADQLMDQGNISNREISFVSQNPYLYNDTLGNNIFLGRTPSPQELNHVLELLKLFELQDLLLDENKKDYSTLSREVGENGARLSGGQIKRICLIRSLFSSTHYLLWDDPFSSLDVLVEKSVFNHLRRLKLLEGKTVLLTTHRLTTVKQCQHIVMVDKESSIAEAKIEELLNPEGPIYALFEKQLV